MKKKLSDRWQRVAGNAILWALCFRIHVIAAEPEAQAQELHATLEESRILLEELRNEKQLLEVALERTRDELHRSQVKYAALAEQSRVQAIELAQLRMCAAHILYDPSFTSRDRIAAHLAEWAQYMQRQNAAVLIRLNEFDEFLAAVLDVLNPSDVLRREISGRFQSILETAKRSERLSPEVAGRGDAKGRLRREARILAVNDTLNLVVIDAGVLDGVRSGSRWRIFHRNKTLGLIQVVLPRAAISAAIPLDGKIERWTPGLTVRLGLEADSE